MLNLNDLEQLITFADHDTLSKAAELLNLSQPTITRTMKHIEEAFGVPLFHRSKNKITLNEAGLKAVEYSRQLLINANDVVAKVQAYDKSLHTIIVESCAPAPLWSLLPKLSTYYPGMSISSSITSSEKLLKDTRSGACDIGILPYRPNGIHSIPFLKEFLSLCVPVNHALASRKTLTFSELNGFNFLLRSKIGFWDELCRTKMPASKFLVQTDDFAFEELVRESSLPCFTTNLATDKNNLLENRYIIPITDPEANVEYSLIFGPNKKYPL
ncbi:MAG: LysR family transcriptional regulator [bacterium]|nr:LysR family transcriptional regulator [bacterium]